MAPAKQPQQNNANDDVDSTGAPHKHPPHIRALLDPHADNHGRQIFDWEDEHLNTLADAIEPEHLGIAIKARQRGRLEEPALPLTWHHLTYTAKDGTKILDDVSGMLLPSTLVGLVGAPDSGITPLLQVVSGQTQHLGKLEGDILYDGIKRGDGFKRAVGFAVKEDTHLPTLTVFESLYFSARLRLPDTVPDNVIRYRVRVVLKLLGMSHTTDSMVGDASIRGISGGEKRRLGFGLEMVAGHSVILADLPTNGLDSATAYGLIHTLRYACQGGMSVMVSLVQPSLELFMLLDRVNVMSKGRTIYFGPPGSIEAYFEEYGFHRPSNKSIPQFVEELTATPEAFYTPSITRQLSQSGNTKYSQQDEQRTTNEGLSKPKPRRQISDEELQEADEHMTQVQRREARVEAWNSISKQFQSDDSQRSILKLLDNIQDNTGHRRKAAKSKMLKHGSYYHKQLSSPEPRDDDEPDIERNAPQSGSGSVASTTQTSNDNSMSHQNRDYNNTTTNGTVSPQPPTKRTTNKSDPIANQVSEVEEWTWPWLNHKGLSKKWYGTYSSSFWLQYKTNLWRQFTLTKRNVGLWRDSWVLATILGFIVGSLFWQVGIDQTGIQSRIGLLQFILSYLGFNTLSIIPVVEGQRAVFYSQKERKYYHPLSYFYAIWSIQVPITLVEAFLLLMPVWGLAGLSGWPFISDTFWYAYIILVVHGLVARTWCILLSAACPNPVYTTVTLLVTNIIFANTNGYFTRVDRIPGGWYWAHTLSYFTYSLLGLVTDDLSRVVNYCDPATATAAEPCNFRQGTDAAYQLYGLNADHNKWFSFGELCIFLVTFTLFGGLVQSLIDYSRPDTPESPQFNEEAAKKEEARGGAQKDKRETRVDIGGTEMTDQNKKDMHANGMKLDFYDLCYDVQIPDDNGKTKDKRLLNNVYGYCHPGMMVALMGATGAGKTTLLDVLAGKKTSGKISGTLLFNGKPRGPEFSHEAGYVEQFDSHNPFSTVREAIEFAGRLRLPPETSHNDVQEKVERVMNTLNISHLGGAIIGQPGMGGVSQEIRKKVTIAVELIMEPKLLFLDEPTTGLDSAGASAVMAAVRKIAREMSVVCTIHQPAAEIVGMFDWMMLLKPGGHVVYFNPMKHLPSYFKSQGVGDCPPEKNIADFALEQVKRLDKTVATDDKQKDKEQHKSKEGDNEGLSQPKSIRQRSNQLVRQITGSKNSSRPPSPQPDNDAFETAEEPTEANVQRQRFAKYQGKKPDHSVDLADEFRKSKEGKQVRSTIMNTLKEYGIEVTHDDIPTQAVREGPRTSRMLQTVELTKREFYNVWRDRENLAVRYILVVFFGFSVGTVDFQLGFSQTDAPLRLAALFLTMLFAMFTSASFLPGIFMARPIYFREVVSDMYAPFPFYVARYIAQMPYILSEMIILAAMVQYISLINLGEGYFFGWYFLVLVVLRYVGLGLIYTLGAFIASPSFANSLATFTFNLMFCSSGFLIPWPSILYGSVFWAWLYEVNFVHYVLAFASALAIRDQVYTCPSDIASGYVVPIPEGYTSCANVIQPGLPEGYKCAIQCGKDVLDQFGVRYTDSWIAINLCITLAFAIGLFWLAFVGVKTINHIKR